MGGEGSTRQREQTTCVKFFKDENSRALSENCIEIFSKMDGALHAKEQCQGMALVRVSRPDTD